MKNKELIIICITLIICVVIVCGTLIYITENHVENQTNNTTANMTTNNTVNNTTDNATSNATTKKTTKTTSQHKSSDSDNSNRPAVDSDGITREEADYFGYRYTTAHGGHYIGSNDHWDEQAQCYHD
ncbi:hypothetical protein [uncultured Methanosphaera sp.]|uniref:hypothetical protein n=1 Tax=uncultured Methanosphaera sp. TaxID=262501 RepID=UPI000DC3BDDE|nr:hypothetical protein [uncultured Methanosphaera sp.]RAP43561.1 MAG: hypothetical protein BZ134_06610 [Methanosphaera sp. SHI1033]